MKLLLITGCINVNKDVPFVKQNITSERLEQYLKTIKWAIEDSNFDIIIFGENSNYKYDFNKYVDSLNCSKIFEYLTFKGNSEKCIKFGKGYGEGEIVKYCYENSKYLKKEKYFYKITGKLIVENITPILIHDRYGNCFTNILDNDWVDTRFYKLSTNDYKRYFIDAYNLVNDYKGKSLEYVYYHVLKNNNISYKNFKRYPIYNGISGTTNRPYKTNKLIKLIGNILCFFNLYNTKILKNIYKIKRR